MTTPQSDNNITDDTTELLDDDELVDEQGKDSFPAGDAPANF